MRTKLAMFVMGIAVLLAGVPTVAHHSFAAEFDSNKPISLTGTVTKIEWMNPHAYFYIDVKDEGGRSRIGAWRWGARTVSCDRAGPATR